MNEVLYTAYLEGSLLLSKEGLWFHEGTAFTNEKVKKLFHQSIQWDHVEKRFYVVIGPGRAEFSLEDTAFFVAELITESSPWRVRLLDASVEELDRGSLAVGEQNQIYCAVKGGHRARFMRGAFQDLLSYAVSEKQIRIDGVATDVKPAHAVSFIS